MRNLIPATVIIAAALFASGEARAAPASREAAAVQTGLFGAPAIADAELGLVRGGAPLPRFTATNVRTMAEDQSRFDFTGTAQVARVSMDNWWNDVGAQLIVDNFSVRP